MDVRKLEAFLAEQKQPKYRFAQVKQAFCVERADSWDAVTPWPVELREKAAIQIPWDVLTCVRTLKSKADDTAKFLFKCEDGSLIETVLMRHEDERNTVCVSSQVGCPMKCAFCATGAQGFTRNLTGDEIFEQVVQVSRWLKPQGLAVSNVVYMGMGEPMHNYDEVMRSVRLLNDPKGFALGVRHLSISTCGIVPGILKLADEPERVNLAISLHAAIPEIRSRIMPVNSAYPLDQLMDAVRIYAEKTNRKVMFEYLLLDGINDTPEAIDALIMLMDENRRLYHVNLIKYHDTHVFTATPEAERLSIFDQLKKVGISVTLRHSFGEDILAACGQLAGTVS